MALMNNRVAFHTIKRTEALYFLGDYGAEKLPPYGACLFAVKGEEIKAVDTCMVHANDNIIMATHWSHYNPSFIKDMYAQKEDLPSLTTLDEHEEELYQRCVALVTTERRATPSLLQRRLSIGYGRAAKMLDIMEERGVVSPPQGAVCARTVLV
jgi:S-DNA-T family DNA segregation ATPase FtsK/SpoIIIE